jgi:thiamine-monophosphate kinase
MTRQTDEFSLIEKYFAPLAADAPGAFGLGDDAALFTPSSGMELVLTTDAIVEGVHFLSGDPAGNVARKLLRVNLSDLAAKGACPRGYLLTAAWRTETAEAWIAAFAAGLAEDQAEFGIALWGGDTVSTPGPLTFSLTAIGEVPAGAMLRRAGAQAGDDLYVTGTIGDGALGLQVALGTFKAPPADAAALLARYRCPEPRVAFGPQLTGIAGAALDVSDGLMADLTHLCEQSGVGARVEVAAVPLSAAAGAALERDPVLLRTVLTGGDDYEILFAAAPEQAAAVDSLARVAGLRITRIGSVTDAAAGILAVDASGAALAFTELGFQHR